MNQSKSTLSEIRSSPTNITDDNQWKHSNGSSDTHNMNQSTSTPGTLIERNKKQRKILPEIRSSSTKTSEDNQRKHSNGSSGPNHMNLTDKIKNKSTPGTQIEKKTRSNEALCQKSGPHQQIPLKKTNGNIQTALPVLIT